MGRISRTKQPHPIILPKPLSEKCENPLLYENFYLKRVIKKKQLAKVNSNLYRGNKCSTNQNLKANGSAEASLSEDFN